MVVAALRRKPFVVEVRDLWPESLVSGGALKEGSALHKVLQGWKKNHLRPRSPDRRRNEGLGGPLPRNRH
ncbi:glycosyltransferase [Cutibacterium acnes JCM 18916]|nr:glycosyltransferase [Cutibacterium acnes JCM 18916]